MIPLYGLIGYPLEHSFSPAYFKMKFAAQRTYAAYESFPLPQIADLPALIRKHPNLEGLNVTIPYKEAVIHFLDEIDSVAAEIGAVNCITLKNGHKKGYNTDAAGFEQSLNPLLEHWHTHALILGTGGAAKAVAYVLKQLGISFLQTSTRDKSGKLAYEDITAELINRHKLIINTTPLGMYPHMGIAPTLPYDAITPRHLLYDLIYNPTETKFLSIGREKGAVTKNGYEMLKIQADASWDIWSGGGNVR